MRHERWDEAIISDLATIVSRDFLRNHHDDFIVDYGFIREPKMQIRRVQSSTVSYAQRTPDTEPCARSGWAPDNDAWDSVLETPEPAATAERNSNLPVRDPTHLG
jgi:hypothetical protein